MKKYCFLAVIAVAMLAVSCSDADPFLGDLKHNNYKTNKKNFDTFADVLLEGCYCQWSYYEKVDDGHWFFQDWDNNPVGGNAGQYFLMIESTTLLQYTTNFSVPPGYEKFTEYTIAYDAKTGTICLTEILQDGTNGETYFSILLSGAPRPVIEGPFAGMHYLRGSDNGFVEPEIRWCFKECGRRAEILTKYEKWLSEQE